MGEMGDTCGIAVCTGAISSSSPSNRRLAFLLVRKLSVQLITASGNLMSFTVLSRRGFWTLSKAALTSIQSVERTRPSCFAWSARVVR